MSNDITVIVPTYNRATFLRETLDSILSQGVSLRVIVIDDGSTDDTQELASSYADSVEWLLQENQGEVRTVNRGLRMIDTPFFAVVNSDDPLLPGSLSTMIDALRAEPDALAAYCDWLTIDAESNPGNCVRVSSITFDDMMLGVNNAIGPGSVFSCSVLELVGFRNPLLKYSADLDYWHRIALAGKILYVPEVLATHRVHLDSASIKDRGRLLSSEVVNLHGAYTLHPLWAEEGSAVAGSLARSRRSLCAAYFSASFVASSRQLAGRMLLRSFFLAPMRAFGLLKQHGVSAASAAFERMPGLSSGDGANCLALAFSSTSRRRSLRLVARALHRDLVGSVNALEGLHAEDVRSLLQNMVNNDLQEYPRRPSVP